MQVSHSIAEVRQLVERPMLTLNLVRRLADEGLTTGSRHQWSVFDPATLRNAPVIVNVGARARSARAKPTPMIVNATALTRTNRNGLLKVAATT